MAIGLYDIKRKGLLQVQSRQGTRKFRHNYIVLFLSESFRVITQTERERMLRSIVLSFTSNHLSPGHVTVVVLIGTRRIAMSPI
jgi:hypothetical protein